MDLTPDLTVLNILGARLEPLSISSGVQPSFPAKLLGEYHLADFVDEEGSLRLIKGNILKAVFCKAPLMLTISICFTAQAVTEK